MLTVDTVVQFFPRGGSAQVIRYLAREFTARGTANRILCGTLGAEGDLGHAPSFYRGLDVAAMDYGAAAAAYTGGCTGMDGQQAPFHPSYEDRGPAAPDRMFTAVPPATTAQLVRAWARHLAARRSASPGLVHLHHLSHLQQAVRCAYPGTPVITTFHGTDLKMLDQAQQATDLARQIGTSLTALRDSCRPGDSPAVARLARQAGLTADQVARARATDWRLWPYADAWSDQMYRNARLAGQIVVVSDSDAAAAARLLALPESALTVIPNGVDTTQFTPRNLGTAQRLDLLRHWLVDDPRGWGPGQPPGSIRYTASDLTRMTDAAGELRPVLLWVGRYQKVKRLNVLLAAFARLVGSCRPAPILLLWGGYPGETEDEHPLTTARKLGIDRHVYFIGWRGHDELPAGMNCADLMVAPAVNESFGMIYVEAQACGTPPVATRTGGPATLITSDGPRADGWTVRPDDPRALACTIAAVLADPAERARRAANGTAAARDRYSWPTVADQYEAAYETSRKIPA